MDRQLALQFVSDLRCECEQLLLKDDFTLEDARSQRIKFSVDCSYCPLSWKGKVVEHNGQILLSARGFRDDFDRPVSFRQAGEFIPKHLLDHSRGKEVSELVSDVFLTGHELAEYADRLTDNMLVGPDEYGIANATVADKIAMRADIDAYLAGAYTFKKRFKSVVDHPAFPEKARARRLLEEYRDNSRVIEGLRIYSQKERALPLKWKVMTGRNTEEQILPALNVGDVWVMETKKTDERPTGYKKGAAHHYETLIDLPTDGVDELYDTWVPDERVIVSDIINEHVAVVERLADQLVDATLAEDSEAYDDIQEAVEHHEAYIEQMTSVLGIDDDSVL